MAACIMSVLISPGATSAPPGWPCWTPKAAWCMSALRRTTTDRQPRCAPYTEGPCVVAIDAPLIVTNPTGNRPAEAALNSDFARFDAGAHPSNTGKPEFPTGLVARGSAGRLGLDLDPRPRAAAARDRGVPAPGDGGAVPAGSDAEVQEQARPHADAAARRSCCGSSGLLEGLADADPPLRLVRARRWPTWSARSSTATRKSDLRRAEDQVDAVVCAYVALFADARPERRHDVRRLRRPATSSRRRCRRASSRPSSRRPASRTRSATRCRSTPRGSPSCARPTEQYVALVTALLDDAGINYLSVTGRAKTVASFAAKAARTVDGAPRLRRPAERDHRPDRASA